MHTNTASASSRDTPTPSSQKYCVASENGQHKSEPFAPPDAFFFVSSIDNPTSGILSSQERESCQASITLMKQSQRYISKELTHFAGRPKPGEQPDTEKQYQILL